ncbi:MAG: MOSC domain-containing protein [Verrucomicrobiota bacterium]
MNTLRLLGIQVGTPRTFSMAEECDASHREWTTGFYKEPVTGPVRIARTNLAGDGQADLRNHGGPDKAICLYPRDHWLFWKAELGLELPHGAFGENFTTEGAVEAGVCIGDIFRCGTALLQISQPRQPCWKLARRWRIKDLAAKVERTGRTGWYFRVLEEGHVEPGTALDLLERLHPQWTVAAANDVMHQRKTDWEAARHLAACADLSESWKVSLARRAATQTIAGAAPRLDGA